MWRRASRCTLRASSARVLARQKRRASVTDCACKIRAPYAGVASPAPHEPSQRTRDPVPSTLHWGARGRPAASGSRTARTTSGQRREGSCSPTRKTQKEKRAPRLQRGVVARLSGHPPPPNHAHARGGGVHTDDGGGGLPPPWARIVLEWCCGGGCAWCWAGSPTPRRPHPPALHRPGGGRAVGQRGGGLARPPPLPLAGSWVAVVRQGGWSKRHHRQRGHHSRREPTPQGHTGPTQGGGGKGVAEGAASQCEV